MSVEATLEAILAPYWPGRRVVVVMTAEFPALLEAGYLVVSKRDGPSQLLCLAAAVPALHNWFRQHPGESEIDPKCIKPALPRPSCSRPLA